MTHKRFAEIITAKLKVMGELLSKPWAGPSIGLVVLCVSLVSLAYNKSGFDRQTARWQAEEDNQIQLQLHIEPGLTPDGYRTAYVQLYFRLTDPVRFERLEATAPNGITIRAVDPKVVKSGTASPTAFNVDETVGPVAVSGPSITFLIAFRTPQTPLDQNSIIQIRADLSELTGKKRHLERQTRAAIPSDAKKAP
jgi:hypothetical protein